MGRRPPSVDVYIIPTEIMRWKRNPWVSTRFGLGAENEPTDSRGDGRTCLARPSYQARTGPREKTMVPVQVIFD